MGNPAPVAEAASKAAQVWNQINDSQGCNNWGSQSQNASASSTDWSSWQIVPQGATMELPASSSAAA
eukprot:7041904-Prorocentrum_lima.AAC.1